MADPWKFLDAWRREHVNATAYDDKVTAANLARECLRDSRASGRGPRDTRNRASTSTTCPLAQRLPS